MSFLRAPHPHLLEWCLVVLCVFVPVIGFSWFIWVWIPAHEAAIVQGQLADQVAGDPFAQACLHFLQRQHGDKPPLSHAHVTTWTWESTQVNGARTWTLDGTLLFGQQLEGFDCDGLQSPEGTLTVQAASGTPWWTLPPD